MAKNEFGAPLDRNGYAPSIAEPFRDYPRCFICGRTTGKLERHEIFGGSNRQRSKADGLWVHLCPDCHRGPHGVHQSAVAAELLHCHGQNAAQVTYGWTDEEFRQRYGKTYPKEE